MALFGSLASANQETSTLGCCRCYFCHSYRVISLQVNVVLPAFTVSFTSDFVQVLPTLCLLLDANAVPAVKQMLPLAMPSAKMAGANRFATGFFVIVPLVNISMRPGLPVPLHLGKYMYRRYASAISEVPLSVIPHMETMQTFSPAWLHPYGVKSAKARGSNLHGVGRGQSRQDPTKVAG